MTNPALKRVVRVLSAIAGLTSAVPGIGVAWDGYYLYALEARNPFYSVPVWKSSVVLALIVVALVIPLFAAYRFIRFAIKPS